MVASCLTDIVGSTPLFRMGPGQFLKLDYLLPTHSFADRVATALISAGDLPKSIATDTLDPFVASLALLGRQTDINVVSTGATKTSGISQGVAEGLWDILGNEQPTSVSVSLTELAPRIELAFKQAWQGLISELKADLGDTAPDAVLVVPTIPWVGFPSASSQSDVISAASTWNVIIAQPADQTTCAKTAETLGAQHGLLTSILGCAVYLECQRHPSYIGLLPDASDWHDFDWSLPL